MNTGEIELFIERLSLFAERGLAHADSESLADNLVIRDRESDDRRICLECMNLRGYGAASWRCSDSQAAGISINRRDLQLPSDLVVQLQRCDGFLAHLTVRHDYEVEIDETE